MESTLTQPPPKNDRCGGDSPTNGLNGAGLRKLVWRALIFVLGTIVLVVGFCMIILPGPAVIVIPAGLAILATEFVWARRILEAAKDRLKRVRQHAADYSRGKM